MQDLPQNPCFSLAMKLSCPYCGQEPLLKDKSRFHFREGCLQCDYIFEREVGYYSGASQLINFPLVAVLAFVLAAGLMLLFPQLDLTYVILCAGSVMIAFGVFFMPYSMAVWMVFDHKFSPLMDKDRLSKQIK